MAAADGGESTKPSTRRQKNPKQEDALKWQYRSIFGVPPEFFASCRVLCSPVLALSDHDASADGTAAESRAANESSEHFNCDADVKAMQRWSCNTCKAEFESLQEQRLHFKSDLHRFNIKLRIAGKNIIKEEEFDESASDSLCKDYDVSSISGSEDEEERDAQLLAGRKQNVVGTSKNKIFVQLQNGEVIFLWKCLLLSESETILFEDEKSSGMVDASFLNLTPKELLEGLNYIHLEPRDRTRLRIVLLARGGHFAGCVFDGDSLVIHKTFHRYVVRAKAGKKQSSKDASGRSIHSAGASLRRHNELSLKRDIREVLASWAAYFSAATCIFIHAPSSNRQLLFDGEKPCFICQPHATRYIPVPVRRPTLKEAKRIYSLLVQISPTKIDEMIGNELSTHTKSQQLNRETEPLPNVESTKVSDVSTGSKELSLSVEVEVKDELESVTMSTELHEAAKSGDAQKVSELLEQGLDPCIKDERGQTPYMFATEKEVRNTFRRFMASNLEKWDWHAAKVPSALTKEMEESQAVKQAEKDAKRKAKAKEMKKLKKAKEKAQRAEAALPENRDPPVQTRSAATTSKEEDLQRTRNAERERRAAAAEKRIAEAAASALKAKGAAGVSSLETHDITVCSLCSGSLANKIPFHRYHYKYCSSSCMHAHREVLEDG